MVTEEPMNWITLSIPFMTLAVAVALGPIIWAIVHETRHGRGEPARSAESPSVGTPRLDPRLSEVTVCPHCSSVVADAEAHIRAIHHAAA